jgi:hypothetical protein
MGRRRRHRRLTPSTMCQKGDSRMPGSSWKRRCLSEARAHKPDIVAPMPGIVRLSFDDGKQDVQDNQDEHEFMHISQLFVITSGPHAEEPRDEREA